MSAPETSTALIIDFIGVSLDYAAGYSFLPRCFGPTSRLLKKQPILAGELPGS
jgi:hypothetical protein